MNRKEVEHISADMTVLDIVGTYPGTEAVFKSYDEKAEECICCRMLFETVRQVAEKYKLDLSKLLAKLNSAGAD